MKKVDLEELQVVDVRQLSPARLQAMSDLFDEMADAEFERLQGMAGCQSRCSLEDGISRILGLPGLATPSHPSPASAGDAAPEMAARLVRVGLLPRVCV